MPGMFQGFFARVGQSLCSAPERQKFDSLLGKRLGGLSGGELSVARVQETIDDCIALKRAVAPQLQAALRSTH